MKLQIILLIFLNFTYCNGFGQDTLTDDINTRWIKGFEKMESKNAKLMAIRQKIFDDRIYNVSQKRKCITLHKKFKLIEKKDIRYYECKILFILDLFGMNIILDAAQQEEVLLVCREFKVKNIEAITVLKFPQSAALYGSDGLCGVVILKSKSKKLKRRLEELKLYN